MKTKPILPRYRNAEEKGGKADKRITQQHGGTDGAELQYLTFSENIPRRPFTISGSGCILPSFSCFFSRARSFANLETRQGRQSKTAVQRSPPKYASRRWLSYVDSWR